VQGEIAGDVEDVNAGFLDGGAFEVDGWELLGVEPIGALLTWIASRRGKG
jgi:hypothetical protein